MKTIELRGYEHTVSLAIGRKNSVTLCYDQLSDEDIVWFNKWSDFTAMRTGNKTRISEGNIKFTRK